MKKGYINITASLRQRLLNKARETGRPFNELLHYFAMARIHPQEPVDKCFARLGGSDKSYRYFPRTCCKKRGSGKAFQSKLECTRALVGITTYPTHPPNQDDTFKRYALWGDLDRILKDADDHINESLFQKERIVEVLQAVFIN